MNEAISLHNISLTNCDWFWKAGKQILWWRTVDGKS